MNILLFGSNGEKLKAAATSLRASGNLAHIRSPHAFRINEVETGYDLLLLLEPCELVREAYEAYNKRAEQQGVRTITIEERLDFDPPSARELDSMSGKPHWPNMSVRELIEYSNTHFKKAITGRSKAEIIRSLDVLWTNANKPKGDDQDFNIPIG